MKAEISEVSNNADALVLEAIHSAGYSGALANPLLAPESAITRLNGTILEEFVAVSSITIFLHVVLFNVISNYLYVCMSGLILNVL